MTRIYLLLLLALFGYLFLDDSVHVHADETYEEAMSLFEPSWLGPVDEERALLGEADSDTLEDTGGASLPSPSAPR